MRTVVLALLASCLAVGTASAQLPSFKDMTAPFKDLPDKMKEIPEKFKGALPDSGAVKTDGRQPAPLATAAGTRVNINRASIAELKTLPGIDDALARNIVDGRPYKGTGDLEWRKIIPPQAYEKIRTRITVNAETPKSSTTGAKRRCSEVGGRVSCRDN
jgi:helix-hairpin-helix protein